MEALLALSPDDEDMAMFAAMYADVSPDGADHFPAVWEKIRTMWAEPFDWTEEVRKISAPTLVIVGDDDYIRVDHADRILPTGRPRSVGCRPRYVSPCPDGEA